MQVGLFDDPELDRLANTYNASTSEDAVLSSKLTKAELTKLATEIQPVLNKMQKCRSYKSDTEQSIAQFCVSADFLRECEKIISHDFHDSANVIDSSNIVVRFREIFEKIYILNTQKSVLAKCIQVYDIYYKRLRAAIDSAEYMSDGFTWMFAPKLVKQNVKDGYQTMVDFKKSGAYALINNAYDVLFDTTKVSDKQLTAAFLQQESAWRNEIQRIVGDIQATSKYLTDVQTVISGFDYILSHSFDDAAFESEIDKYREYVNECIKQETTKDVVVDIYKELENMPLSELNNDKSGIRIGTLAANGFNNLADIYRAPVQSISSIRGISRDTAYKIKHKVDEMVVLLNSQDVTKTEALVLNYDKRTAYTTNIIKSVYYCRKFLVVKNRFSKMGELDYERIRKAVGVVSHFDSPVKWLFLDNQKRKNIVNAYKYLKKQADSDLYKNYVWFVRYTVPGVKNVKQSEAWDDFRDNSVAYYNCIEFLVPNAFEDANYGYGLPEDLAEKVEAQIIYPNGLTCELRRYQVWGVKYILHQGRSLLGDEMGLGKTIQAIASMVSLRNTGYNHFLVICPASVLVNWYKEIRQHSKLQAYMGHGSVRDRNDNVQAWKYNGGVLITTYETYSNLHIDNLADIGLVTVDEAHYIKNPDTNRSRAIRALCAHVERVLFLTGTPIENNVSEMLSLLSVLNVNVTQEAKKYNKVSTSQQFKDSIAPVYFRRKQSDVNKELPEKIEIIDWCSMNDREWSAYESAAMNAMNPFMPMRRVSWNVMDLSYSTKANKLVEIVEDAVADKRKVIVFSFFKDTIAAVQALFKGHCSAPIDGSLSPAKRQEIIDNFSKDPEIYVLISQIQAGGTGLNIQAASVVVMCEPQVKPSIENQAIARAHRMGQSRNVIVHRLCSEDTIDERMLEVLDKKKEQFEVFADRSVSGDKSLELNDSDVKNIISDEIERIKKRRGIKTSNTFKDSEEGQEWRETDKEIGQLYYTKIENRGKARTVTEKQRYRILNRDNFTCQKCGRFGPGSKDKNGNLKAEPAGGFAILEVDHKTPHSLGGSDDDENLWVLCEKCNGGKSNDYNDGNDISVAKPKIQYR